jgi:uncharacterized protein (AIM24 family)
VRYAVTGEILQLANVQLDERESFRSVPGAMIYATGNISAEPVREGGILRAIGRSVSGDGLRQVQYSTVKGMGIVGLGGSAPGRILDMDVGRGRWTVARSGYLGSQPSVSLKSVYRKDAGERTFGKEGFSLLELSGSGIAFAASCGDFSAIDLRDGEEYVVSAAHALAWHSGVGFEMGRMGKAEGDGHGRDRPYAVHLTGPGRIFIQSMSPSALAGSLSELLGAGGGK